MTEGKIPIIGTGLSGLVGTRITQLLDSHYEFTDLSFATGIDITDFPAVQKAFNQSSAKTVLHMAAKADVDGCEDDKILGEEGAAWQINVEGTKNIVQAAKETQKRVLYISTDFVFNGTKDFYIEEDEPDPLNWYGRTKYEGEEAVKQAGIDYCIVRIAYPYRAYFPPRLDFVRRIIQAAQKNEKLSTLTDHIFTPTFIDDIAAALDTLIQEKASGIYHVVGSQSLTPEQATKLILKKFNLQAVQHPVTRAEYFRGRAFRPFKLSLKNDKIRKLGLSMKTFEEGLTEMKNQLASFYLH